MLSNPEPCLPLANTEQIVKFTVTFPLVLVHVVCIVPLAKIFHSGIDMKCHSDIAQGKSYVAGDGSCGLVLMHGCTDQSQERRHIAQIKHLPIVGQPAVSSHTNSSSFDLHDTSATANHKPNYAVV